MPLIQAKLLSNLINFDDSLTPEEGSVSAIRKLKLMQAFNDYAQSVFPTSVTPPAAMMTGYGAFTGDDPQVPYSFAQAWGTALGAYTPVLSSGMAPAMYLPTFIPQAATIIPGLMSVKSVKDKVSQVQILSQVIDAWMHTGINTLTIPPTTVVPTPWV